MRADDNGVPFLKVKLWLEQLLRTFEVLVEFPKKSITGPRYSHVHKIIENPVTVILSLSWTAALNLSLDTTILVTYCLLLVIPEQEKSGA